MKTDESLTAEQKEAKIHQLRRAARVQMVKLLTPEQRQQMRANIRALRAAAGSNSNNSHRKPSRRDNWAETSGAVRFERT